MPTLGNMLTITAGHTTDVVSSGLTHDWGMGEDVLGPLRDRISGFHLTAETGQALDYVPGDYSVDTGATDYLMDWLNGKNTLTFGVLLWKDSNQGKVGPGGYYGRPLGWLLDSTHTLRAYFSDGQEHNWTMPAPSISAWHTIVFQLDIPSGTARCWVDGVAVTLTLATTFPTGLTFSVPTSASYRKWYIGASSSSVSSHVTDAPTNGKVGRMFATSGLLTIEQAEAILRGAPADFPTLTDGHIFVLDTEGATVTCKRDGVSTLTHTAAALSTNWANGARQVAPHPQKALGRGIYGGKPGVGFQTTGTNSRSAAAYGGLAAPTQAAILPNGDQTIEAWVRVLASTSTVNTMIWLRNDANSDGIRIFANSGSSTIWATSEGATASVSGSIEWTTHSFGWVHLIFRYTGGAGQWSYMLPSDTTETAIGASTAGALPYSSALSLRVGVGPSGVGYCDQSQIGRMLVYSRALSTAEVLKNHKAMRSAYNA